MVLGLLIRNIFEIEDPPKFYNKVIAFKLFNCRIFMNVVYPTGSESRYMYVSMPFFNLTK